MAMLVRRFSLPSGGRKRWISQLSGASKQHWVAEMQGPDRLRMLNAVTEEEQLVDLPAFSSSTSSSRALCSHQGRLLLQQGGNGLLLGDPLANVWNRLPSPPLEGVHAAAFSEGAETLLVVDDCGEETATLNPESGVWTMGREPDPTALDGLQLLESKPVWHRGAFYAQFSLGLPEPVRRWVWNDDGTEYWGSAIAMYDPLHERRWRNVWADRDGVPFEWHGKLLAFHCDFKTYEVRKELYDRFQGLVPDSIALRLEYESYNELRAAIEQVKSGRKTIEEKLGIPTLPTRKPFEVIYECARSEWLDVYGANGVLFFDTDGGKFHVYLEEQGLLKELPMATNFGVPSPRCYHVSGPNDTSASMKCFMELDFRSRRPFEDSI